MYPFLWELFANAPRLSEKWKKEVLTMKKLIAALLCLCGLICTGALAEWELGTRAQVVNCREYVSLREESAASSARLEKIPLNERVNVLGEGLNGFVRVERGGLIGYIRGDYLKICEDFAGRAMEPGAQERCNINLFLSNFSEQRLPIYDEADMRDEWDAERDAFYQKFAIQHLMFNRPDAFEQVESPLGAARLAMDELDDVIWKYFKTETGGWTAPYNYSGDYYYLNPADKSADGGFVSVYRVDDLGGGRYAARFNSYGAGCGWSNADCGRTPGEAALAYERSAAGMAVIDVGGGSLDDRGTWRLERWIMES